MRKLPALVLLLLLCGCIAPLPTPTVPGRWVYIGNDPEGTQNILMSVQSSDPKTRTVTAWFRFQFTHEQQILTGPAYKSVGYYERHDLVQINCDSQTLRLLDETFHDLNGNQVFKVTPEADGSTANRVFAGGVSDILYEGACGDSVAWTPLGEDPQHTQKIFALIPARVGKEDIVKARFRFAYEEPREMVAAPSLDKVRYVSRQSIVYMDCANQTFSLIHETYYDENGVAVFGVTPPKDARPTAVVPDSVTGMMYNAACGIPLNWVYLGNDPRNTQKVFMVGTPSGKSGGDREARFRFEYLAPGKLVTGTDLKQIIYNSRTADLQVDCPNRTTSLIKESYQDGSGKEVFSVTPESPQPTPIAPQGLTGMLYRAVCQTQ